METIGFIGLGTMGMPMAINIQKAGYPMVVYDIREGATKPLLEGGASLADSPAEVARRSDVTFASVPGPKEVEEVAMGPQGVVQGIKQGAIYVDLSTSRPSLIQGIEPAFRRKGAHVLDAPILTSKTDAVNRNLILMVGGDRRVYEQIYPIFEAFSDKIVYTGGLGMGNICKLVNNMVNFGVRQVISEGLTLGVKAGLDLEVLLESGSRGAMGNMAPGFAETVFRGEFEPPNFTLALARKDLGLATELGRDYGVPMPLSNLTEQFMIQGMNRGWASKDRIITFLLQEEMAGVEVRAKTKDT